jgi:hypothetical protein
VTRFHYPGGEFGDHLTRRMKMLDRLKSRAESDGKVVAVNKRILILSVDGLLVLF